MSNELRKADHISICMDRDVKSSINYWDDVALVHHAVPSCNFGDIDLSLELFGRRLKAPIILAAMTGGSKKSIAINENLARAAAELGLGMGVGSQRCAIDDPANVDTEESYAVVRKHKVPLVIANVGAPQLIAQAGKKAYGIKAMRKAMEMVGGHVLAVHLNYLQETIQPEGDLNAKGLSDAIKKVARDLPVIAKETGAGINLKTALMLKKAGAIGIDVGGLGGTSFAAVEHYRAALAGDRRRETMGRTFWNWGIPTPVSLAICRVELPLIATGGIRNGLDAARAFAMGASAVGIAGELLGPASRSYKELKERLETIIHELKIAIFLSGAFDITSFSENATFVVTGPTKGWLEAMGVFN